MSTYHYKKKIEKGKIFKEIILIYCTIVLFILLFNSLLFQAFKIPTNSMEPSLKEGVRILVDKFSIGPKYPLTNRRVFDATESQVKRGDIIAFYSNEYYNKGAFYRSITTFLYTISFTLIDVPSLTKHYDSSVYVKRVVGIPGDKIRFRLINDEVILTINGIPEKEIIPENYQIVKETRSNSKLLTTMIIQNEYILKDNEYYVLGDNRISSSDSRIWGSVKKDQIIGKVIFKYWPFDAFGVAK
ncbi:MAG: signal peptidase I [Spirochaetales bacterium]|nr:signal peptidase I [Spirochaetales bacterium]